MDLSQPPIETHEVETKAGLRYYTLEYGFEAPSVLLDLYVPPKLEPVRPVLFFFTVSEDICNLIFRTDPGNQYFKAVLWGIDPELAV